ncbi:MAG: nicotinate-nucleotide--dimethylbenzimidazole phosphoribosyltransferase [Desulfobacteraceae bacterium]|nr:MAG: nicotinate-nucleotide--dimethylbenzimidazole phosphoribosyltransferase [Desulfobacteraceae bacterium]
MKLVLQGLRKLEMVPAADPSSLGPSESPDTQGYVNVDVICCAICRTDAKMWEQGHRDLVFPRVLGHEMVVDSPQMGRCVAWPGKSCGTCRFCLKGEENLCDDMMILGFHTDGGFADTVQVPQDSLIPIPDDLDAAIACFAEPVACAINAFEKCLPGGLDRDTASLFRVLIIGGGTMGLVTALYAKSLGCEVLVIEKSEEKIQQGQAFFKQTGIACAKETHESEFDMVINACADFIAFCQAITKVDKAGNLSFFSGMSKNESIETNLLNLLHYKEVRLAGAYGCKKNQMEQAVGFMAAYAKELELLIQGVVPPEQAPDLIPDVLEGKGYKWILDFRGQSHRPVKVPVSSEPEIQSFSTPEKILDAIDIDETHLCRQTIRGILPVSQTLYEKAVRKMDEKTKPLGALGSLEDLAIRMCLVQDTLDPVIEGKFAFVFAGDHGITQEGVSAYPSEVTGQMVENFLNGGAAINVLCRHHSIDLKVVDMGVAVSFAPHPDLIRNKVAEGTRNFAVEPAMTEAQMINALEGGMQAFLNAHEVRKIDIVGLGEMGIGNTTSASAIISTVTGITPAQATGRGTGVDDKGLEHKTEVIERALAFHQPDPKNGLEILQKIGGFEIAGIAGAALAAASCGTAVVLDGVISTAAGLIAYLINPDIKGYLFASHKSVEIGHMAALEYMGLNPLIDFHMRLGEGTGAALTIDLIDAACRIMGQMASFDDARVSRSSGGNGSDKL